MAPGAPNERKRPLSAGAVSAIIGAANHERGAAQEGHPNATSGLAGSTIGAGRTRRRTDPLGSGRHLGFRAAGTPHRRRNRPLRRFSPIHHRLAVGDRRRAHPELCLLAGRPQAGHPGPGPSRADALGPGPLRHGRRRRRGWARGRRQAGRRGNRRAPAVPQCAFRYDRRGGPRGRVSSERRALLRHGQRSIRRLPGHGRGRPRSGGDRGHGGRGGGADPGRDSRRRVDPGAGPVLAPVPDPKRGQDTRSPRPDTPRPGTSRPGANRGRSGGDDGR